MKTFGPRRIRLEARLVRLLVISALLLGSVVGAGSFAQKTSSDTKHAIQKQAFGKMPDGRVVDVYTLTNSHGVEARIMNFGAILLSLRVADRNHKFDDVVLGFERLEPYFTNDPHFGSIIGRYANRIANGKFTLDGVEYKLPANNGPNHLHGTFSRVVWQAKVLPSSEREAAVQLTYLSEDGEAGNLWVDVVPAPTTLHSRPWQYGYFGHDWPAPEGDVIDGVLMLDNTPLPDDEMREIGFWRDPSTARWVRQVGPDGAPSVLSLIRQRQFFVPQPAH